MIHVHISLGQFLLTKKTLKGHHQGLHEEPEGSLHDETSTWDMIPEHYSFFTISYKFTYSIHKRL